MRWRLELSCFTYDIIFRPGIENIVTGDETNKTQYKLIGKSTHELEGNYLQKFKGEESSSAQTEIEENVQRENCKSPFSTKQKLCKIFEVVNVI